MLRGHPGTGTDYSLSPSPGDTYTRSKYAFFRKARSFAWQATGKNPEISGDTEKLAKIGNIENLLHVTVNRGKGDLFLGATHFVTQHQKHAER